MIHGDSITIYWTELIFFQFFKIFPFETFETACYVEAVSNKLILNK